MLPYLRTAHEFRTTHWSLVLEAGAGTEAGHSALETLCRAYWYPLYAFVRRRGYEPAEAEDLTQEFFTRLLAAGGLVRAAPEKERFRTFLLASLKNFLANEWDKSRRLKRGLGIEFLRWDELDAEGRFRLDPAAPAGDESLFDRQWAEKLVSEVLARLRAEAVRESSVARFDALKAFLVTDAPARYAEIGAQLGLSGPAVKSAIHRLRRRYADLLRAAVADTLSSSDDVEAEIRYLFATLSA